jgi:hypothetical protein
VLDLSEIRPGLVVRLDTAVLRSLGGSETNAQATPDEDRAVTGVHDFVVVATNAATSVSMLLPVFPRSAPGSAPLDASKMHGPSEWASTPWFYSRWQHWRVPHASIVAASSGDPSSSGARRTYAEGDVDALRALENWATRNRCGFRPA